MADTSRSPIKWVGGKRWLAPRIKTFYDAHRDKRFVELFSGGLGASFFMKPEKVLANDINAQLIHFFEWLKTDGKIAIDRTNTEETYYQHRARYNELIASNTLSAESASLFYYLNRCGFNGLYRTNKKGAFNTPYGKYKFEQIVESLAEHSEVVANWEFVAKDFRDVELRPGDFIFSDSPYDNTFQGYDSSGFPWELQVHLAESLAAHQGPVIITNAATDRIVELYTSLGFDYQLIPRRGKINTYRVLKDELPLEIFAFKNV